MVQNAGVGALLRSRREELGQDTESVSRQLRIRAIYIRAIEEGRMQDLPGAAYAVGFVRTYADFLGFDGNSVVANYRDELGQRGRPDSVNWQIEDKDGGFPIGRLLIVLVVIAAAAYGIWYYLANTQSGSGLIEAVPEYLKKSTGTDKAATPASGGTTSETAPAGQSSTPAPSGSSSEAAPSGAPTDAQAASTPTTGTGQAGGGEPAQSSASTGSAPVQTANPATPSPTVADAAAQPTTTTPAQPVPGQTVANTAGQPTTGQVPAAGSQTTAGQAATGQVIAGQTPPAQTATAPSSAGEATPDVAAAAASSTTRISVRAKLESWVQINDKDGKPVLSRVLRAGETYAVPDEKGLVMNTGNAGGIEVVVDGKTLPSLGSIGLVKRNIVLDPDKLAAGSVVTKTPAKTEPAEGAAPTAPTGD